MISPVEILATMILPFAAVFLIVVSAWQNVETWFDNRDLVYQSMLDEFLWEEMTGRKLATQCVFSMFIGWLFGWGMFGIVASFGIAAVFYRFPIWAVQYKIRKRHDLLEQQLEKGLGSLGNSMRAGLTFIGAVKEGARNLHAPICEEFTLIGKRYDLGKPLDEVMSDSRKRFRSDHYDLAILAILVSRKMGGNLSETLDRISEFMRDVFAIDRKIRIVTAEGRFSAKIISLSPAFMALMLWIGAPEAIVPLFTDPIGGVILFVVAVLNLIGYAWIQAIVAIRV